MYKALADLSRRRAANAESFAYLQVVYQSSVAPGYVLLLDHLDGIFYHDDMKSSYVMVLSCSAKLGRFWNLPSAHVSPGAHLGDTFLP